MCFSAVRSGRIYWALYYLFKYIWPWYNPFGTVCSKDLLSRTVRAPSSYCYLLTHSGSGLMKPPPPTVQYIMFPFSRAQTSPSQQRRTSTLSFLNIHSEKYEKWRLNCSDGEKQRLPCCCCLTTTTHSLTFFHCFFFLAVATCLSFPISPGHILGPAL